MVSVSGSDHLRKTKSSAKRRRSHLTVEIERNRGSSTRKSSSEITHCRRSLGKREEQEKIPSLPLRRSGRKGKETSLQLRRSGREEKKTSLKLRRSGREGKETTLRLRRGGREGKKTYLQLRRSGREGKDTSSLQLRSSDRERKKTSLQLRRSGRGGEFPSQSIDDCFRYLGVECGATRSVALLVDQNDELVQRVECGPANLSLMTDEQLEEHLRHLKVTFPNPSAIGMAMAGVRQETDRRRLKSALAKMWPRVPSWVGSDSDSALAAADLGGEKADVSVVVICGTGSCVFGRGKGGKVKVGGWGHLLGDRSSGYHIAMHALRTVIMEYDRTGVWPQLGQRLLASLLLNSPDDLVSWVHRAKKDEVASLAAVVLSASDARNCLATRVAEECADLMAEDTVACIRRLTRNPRDTIRVTFSGSVLLKSSRFASLVKRKLHSLLPRITVSSLHLESASGAVHMARTCSTPCADNFCDDLMSSAEGDLIPTSCVPSPTEQRNPHSLRLDSIPLASAIQLMLQEESNTCPKLLREGPKIKRAVLAIARSLRRGGRLFYVGAGTSGRLGVLDASECPPTFRVPPTLVQGIIAGGHRALWSSIEGAEDNLATGRHVISSRGINSKDVVVGIAASGRTPFVWGAIAAAKNQGSFTILICFNPHLKFRKEAKPNLVISPDLGPEVLTGSTRLKSGTATKILLNIFSTLTMVRLGKVAGNLMVDLNPSSKKLRQRAVRILEEFTGASEQRCRSALVRCSWEVRKAMKILRESHL